MGFLNKVFGSSKSKIDITSEEEFKKREDDLKRENQDDNAPYLKKRIDDVKKVDDAKTSQSSNASSSPNSSNPSTSSNPSDNKESSSSSDESSKSSNSSTSENSSDDEVSSKSAKSSLSIDDNLEIDNAEEIVSKIINKLDELKTSTQEKISEVETKVETLSSNDINAQFVELKEKVSKIESSLKEFASIYEALSAQYNPLLDGFHETEGVSDKKKKLDKENDKEMTPASAAPTSSVSNLQSSTSNSASEPSESKPESKSESIPNQSNSSAGSAENKDAINANNESKVNNEDSAKVNDESQNVSNDKVDVDNNVDNKVDDEVNEKVDTVVDSKVDATVDTKVEDNIKKLEVDNVNATNANNDAIKTDAVLNSDANLNNSISNNKTVEEATVESKVNASLDEKKELIEPVKEDANLVSSKGNNLVLSMMNELTKSDGQDSKDKTDDERSTFLKNKIVSFMISEKKMHLERLSRNVDPAKKFITAHGDISNLLDLIHIINNNDDIFYEHVTSEKDDFGNWIDHVLGFSDLAQKLKRVKDKHEYLLTLLSEI